MALFGIARSSRGWRMPGRAPLASVCRAAGREPVLSISAGPERAEQRRVAGILDERPHRARDRREEIRREIGILVDRVARLVAGAVGVSGDGGDRRLGERRRAEESVSVTALERAFLADGDARAAEIGPRPGRRQIGEPVGERPGMAAPADALAVGVEQDHLDAAEPARGQQVGDLQPKALDLVGGGHLADIAAGIRIAELKAEPSGRADVVLVVRAAQRLLDHPYAALESLRRFEQRADLDLPLDAQQAREPERAEQRVAAFGFGDEEADGRRAVDVLDHRGGDHHQPRRRRLLGEQRAEVERGGLGLLERLVDAGEQGATAGRIVGIVADAEPLSGDVVDLGRVQPHVGVGEAEPVRQQAGAGDREAERVIVGGGIETVGGGLEQRQERAGLEDRLLAPVDQRAREARDLGGIAARGAGGDLLRDGLERGAETGGEGGGARDRLDRGERAGELHLLHPEPEAERVVPADIGPPVGIIPDPAREQDRPRRQLLPVPRPDGARRAQQRGRERVDRVPAARDRVGGEVELGSERDRFRPVGRERRHRRAVGRDRDERAINGGRQREGRMGGEDGGEPGPLDRLAEGRETDGAVVRIGADEAFGDLPEALAGRLAGQPDIGREPKRAAAERVVAEDRDRVRERGLVDQAVFDLAADRECHGEHRVAERIVALACEAAGERRVEALDQRRAGDASIRHASVPSRRGEA